ncbi:MAG TPA: site-2 protease family protein [candidate division Zixibacteria bacterium]|nr:site-2 protease family protein [candidate division Zixibacteria bacterium]
MFIFSLIQRSPGLAIAFAITAILAFAYHEFAHAIVADRLDDPTPRAAGRISINPFVHLNAFGILMLFLLGFGWATTPVNPSRLRGNPRTSMAIVAIAGPLANLFMALLYAIPIRLGVISPTLSSGILPTPGQIVLMGIYINLVLFAFNLMPIPPLDGFTILLGLLPPEMAYQLGALRQYGPMILLAILILPSLAGFSIFSIFIDPLMSIIVPILTGLDFGTFTFFLWG